jgi:hypothetical protein
VLFVQAYQNAHKKTQGLYLHILVAHIPAFIERVGSLQPYQMQGAEAHHATRKKIYLNLTNRKPGERDRQCFKQILAMDVSRLSEANVSGNAAVKREQENKQVSRLDLKRRKTVPPGDQL